MRGLTVLAALALVALVAAFWPDRVNTRRGRTAPASDELASRDATSRDTSRDRAVQAHTELGQQEDSAKIPWTVRFVGSDQLPVTPPGVRYQTDNGKPKGIAPTHGVFFVPPERGTVRYREQEWPVREPDTVIQLDQMIPLFLRFIDTETGETLGEQRHGYVDRANDSLLTRGTKIGTPIPNRWTEPPLSVGDPIAYRARRVIHRLRVYRHADIRLQIDGPNGPEAGVTVASARLDRAGGIVTPFGDLQGVTGTSTASGLLIVHGAPMVDDDGLALELRRGNMTMVVRVKLQAGRVVEQSVPFKAGAALQPTNWRVRSEGAEEPEEKEEEEKKNKPPGTIAVRAYRVDGTPASHALLKLNETKRTDANGWAEFHGLPAGVYPIATREPGLLFAHVKATVRSGERTVVTLTEPKGWHTRLRVLGRDKRGVMASVWILATGGWRYVTCENDVQYVHQLTSPDGTLEIGPLPAGRVEVFAWVGTRFEGVIVTEGTKETVIQLR